MAKYYGYKIGNQAAKLSSAGAFYLKMQGSLVP